MLKISKMQPCLQITTGEVYDFCHGFKHLSSMWGGQGQPGLLAKVSLLTSEHPVHLVLRQVCIPHCCCCKDCTTVQKGIKRLAGLYGKEGGRRELMLHARVNAFSWHYLVAGLYAVTDRQNLLTAMGRVSLCFSFFKSCGARFLRGCSCGVSYRLFSLADAAVPARGGALGPCGCPALVEFQLCAPGRGSSWGKWRFLVVVT